MTQPLAQAPQLPPAPTRGAGKVARRLSKGVQAWNWVAGTGKDRGKVGWFAALLAAICFEGLGRKYLFFVPSIAFYFLKDLVLIAGMMSFGTRGPAMRAARGLYGPFKLILGVAIIWTVVQVFNPSQSSLALGLAGLRAYWLWWIAPVVIANALPRAEDRRRGVVALALMGIFIALYAWQQFNSPASASINALTFYDGEARADIAKVGTTGRVRVASTFAYLSGFADFGVLVPTLLLAIAIDSKHRVMRTITIGAAALVLATVGMTASRMGFGLSVAGLVVVALTSGFMRTRAGRWTAILSTLAVVAFLALGQEAFRGLRDRWEGGDTGSRLQDVLLILPPVALTRVDYPLIGIGTGMQQNARFQLGGVTEYVAEEEPARYLVELGVPGYLVVWMARLGLMVGLFRMARVLRASGARGAASAALAFAALTMLGRLVFDHVWQALYFTGVGILLSYYVAALQHLHERQRAALKSLGVRR